MPRLTPPVKRVCYADDITVWATGPKIPQLESIINNYLKDVIIYLKDNSLLISAPKSTVMLFTPDKHQFQMHPDITLKDTQLSLERSPKILVVIMDPSISFHKYCNYVSDRIDKINNMQKALAGSSCGQEKETLLMTYNVLGKYVANYAAPVWSTNASDSSHLLQDYNHMVFGKPSDICTDCGASPQDVRHLFACTTHPTDLSLEDLWWKPVRSIRAFSYLDNGNLD